jgi:hypothetical protein
VEYCWGAGFSALSKDKKVGVMVDGTHLFYTIQVWQNWSKMGTLRAAFSAHRGTYVYQTYLE